MHEKINRLAKGIIDDITPEISLQYEEFRGELGRTEILHRRIALGSSNGVPVKGLAYSSDVRVKVITPAFGGLTANVDLDICFRDFESEGSILEGTIDLITNGGEFSIPFRFTLSFRKADTVLGKLKTMEDFSRIAETDPGTALRIFEYSNFLNAPCMKDLHRRVLYRAFQNRPDKGIALSQFLLACGIPITSEPAVSESLNTPPTEENFLPDIDPVHVKYLERKHHFYEYLRHRLNAEMHPEEMEQDAAQMADHLAALRADSGVSHRELLGLLSAEVEFLRNDLVAAVGFIDSVEQKVRNERQDLLFEYFLLEYLEIMVHNRTDRIGSFIRLCRKFIEDEKMTSLLYFVLRLDDSLRSDPTEYRGFLRQNFSYGSRSPFLYLYACRFYNEYPDQFDQIGSFELQIVHFGKRYNLLHAEILQKSLTQTCILAIRSDRRSLAYHEVYETAIGAGISLNGLNEYYLYSLPATDYFIDDRVLEYFKDGDNLDFATREKLYAFIVQNKRGNSNIYKSYEDRIIAFAIAQVRDRRIDSYLAVIYGKVLEADMFDASYADSLPYILDSCRIETPDSSIRSVIVLYPQIRDEAFYRTENGMTYLPIHNQDAILLFQDAFGNRYVEKPHTISKLLNSPSLNAAAERLFPDSLAQKLKHVSEVLNKKNLNVNDVALLERTMENLPINEDFHAILVQKLIRYYAQHTANGYDPDFLKTVRLETLEPEDRLELCNAYITCGCYEKAFSMIERFGWGGISTRNIISLCCGMIAGDMKSNSTLLNALCLSSLQKTSSNPMILNYLCEQYNGPTTVMYDLLRRSIEQHGDTYDLEERLLAQMIFSETEEHSDTVFHWYISRKKVSDSLIRAYFTVKLSAYFLRQVAVENRIFEYLENSLKNTPDLRTVPVLYQLALTLHYSTVEKLSRFQIDLTETFLKQLVEMQLIFPYFKAFSRYFPLPGAMDSYEIIWYRKQGSEMPHLWDRILPGQNEMIPEEPDKEYYGIFTKKKILFAGETWEYEIRMKENGILRITDRGKIQTTLRESKTGNRFDILNRLSLLVNEKEPLETLAYMDAYLKEDAIAAALFDIL